ncbi:MAG: hypothetical protein ACLQU1_13725 [Bryobacteraceae bacterium]
MVAFRRWFFALGVLILLAGLASAQTSNTPFTCSATVSVPPTLRAEGFTEQIGDIVLTCTGGNAGQFTVNAAGGTVPLPTANISVSLGTNVTSRLINGSVSDALLLIDEPGSALTPVVLGSGPGAPQTVCSSASNGAGVGGCPQYAVNATATNGGTIAVMSSSPTTVTAPANIYQGNWFSYAPNQIQFLGVPILAPVSAGVARIYRITNIRANVSGFSGAALQGTQQLNASVSISSATSVTLNTPFQTAGFVQTSLSVATRNTNNSGGLSTSGSTYPQCASLSFGSVGILQYSENFGTAFKTRNSLAGVGTQGASVSGPGAQNIPGTIYNSESGFEIASGASPLSPNGITGLADFGTRLQAAFHNIPSGVNIWVSVNNVTNTTAGPAGTTNLAALVATGLYPASAAPDSSSTVSAGSVAGYPVIPATTTINSGANAFGLVQLSVDSTGSAYAVWESITNNPAALDTYNFVYAISFTVVSGINSPPIPAGAASVAATVNMSYAPVPPAGSSAATITAWGIAESASPSTGSGNIPRFTDNSTANTAFTVSICETVLLFPFVTNQVGIDTGIAISNTTSDPLGTNQQQGVCNLYWYGNTPPTSAACTSSSTTAGLGCMPGVSSTGTVTPSSYVISSGETSTTLASAMAPGFQGYMIAVCQFELAHGFAFITDVGLRNFAMGYLALVTGTPSSQGVGAKRQPINEVLGQ